MSAPDQIEKITESRPEELTRMAQTIVISRAVGMTWKTTEERMNEIPLCEISSVPHEPSP